MIKTFIADGSTLVTATVTKIPNGSYFFVKNGEPREIFCHCNQGGNELDVTRKGDIVMRVNDAVYPPSINEEVVLVRQSDCTSNPLYTKADRWVPITLWHEVKWAVNARETYRAIGYDHRVNGKFLSSTTHEELLIQGKLLEITKKYNRDSNTDELSAHYVSTFGGCKYTRKVRWERLCADGSWVECADPRPVHTPPSMKS